MADAINPNHYKSHPSGVECIQITEHFSFNLGNAIKYIWRADLKSNALEDLEKAAWYLAREIKKRKRERDADSLREEEVRSMLRNQGKTRPDGHPV